MKIAIINGPNLNLLGVREPEIYGKQNFEGYFEALQNKFPTHELVYFQSNIEGELVNELHHHGFTADGIVLNAAAYTHTSLAIGDAVKAISSPVVEVHISNIFAREEIRHKSFIAPYAKGSICGLGLIGYELAIRAILTNFHS